MCSPLLQFDIEGRAFPVPVLIDFSGKKLYDDFVVCVENLAISND
jgi:hypothetical protein